MSGKSVLSVFLCAVLVFALSVPAWAKTQVPVVFVPGYISSRLVKDAGTPEETRVWKQHIGEKVTAAVKAEMPRVLADAGAAAVGAYDPLFDRLEPYVQEVLEPLRMNDDGTSKYNVQALPHSVSETRLDRLKEIGYYPDHDALRALGNAAGDKNVYCCTLDWRLGQIDNAAVLDRYIQDVLQKTGAEKVNLMGVSYGGQVAMSYLTLYGADAVQRVVLQCPALDGSSIVSTLLSDKRPHITWADLLRLYFTYENKETLLAEIAELVQPIGLEPFLKSFLDRFLMDFFLNCGSVWDLVPSAEYPALRDELLRDGRHDEMIRKSDAYHTQVAARLLETFRALETQGVQVAIIAGYGYDLAVSRAIQSDGVIDLSSATGATAAPVGKTLDGNSAANPATDDLLAVSADGIVDASTGYLPLRTWYVADLLHGLGMNEDKVRLLMLTLLLTDEIRDVYADVRYPRFLVSENACRTVFCAFDACAEGFITPYSTTMRITNLSASLPITISSVQCRGAKLRFGYTVGTRLQPGESMTAEVCGVFPQTDLSTLQVEVRYAVENEKSTVGFSRTQSFRAVRGTEAENILTQPLDADAPVIADTAVKRDGIPDLRTFFAGVLYAVYRVLRFLRLPRLTTK